MRPQTKHFTLLSRIRDAVSSLTFFSFLLFLAVAGRPEAGNCLHGRTSTCSDEFGVSGYSTVTMGEADVIASWWLPNVKKESTIDSASTEEAVAAASAAEQGTPHLNCAQQIFCVKFAR